MEICSINICYGVVHILKLLYNCKKTGILIPKNLQKKSTYIDSFGSSPYGPVLVTVSPARFSFLLSLLDAFEELQLFLVHILNSFQYIYLPIVSQVSFVFPCYFYSTTGVCGYVNERM